MGEHGGVCRVHVVGREDRHGLGRQRGEGGQETFACLRLPPALRRLQNTGAVGHAGSAEGEGLHHAITVEPVAVTMAEALVLGRAVAPEHAREIGRQAAGKRRERCGKRLGLRRGKTRKALRGGERRRGIGGVTRRRPCPAGRH